MPDGRRQPLRVARRTLTRLRSRGAKDVVLLGATRIREAVRSDDSLILLVRGAANGDTRSDGLELRETVEQDGRRYAVDIGTESPDTFAARLGEGARCFVVISDGRFVHATWMTTASAWTREIRGYITPPPGDAYVYESFTRPEARGRGVYPFALREICRRLAREGIASVWVGVEASNPASLRAVTKAGFVEACRVAFRRRLGRLSVGAPAGPLSDACRDSIAPKQRIPSRVVVYDVGACRPPSE